MDHPTIPPGLVGRLCSLSPVPTLPAPGTTSSTAAAPGVITAPTDARVKERGALFGRNPWVGKQRCAELLIPVIIDRHVRAELLRLSGEKRTTIG